MIMPEGFAELIEEFGFRTNLSTIGKRKKCPSHDRDRSGPVGGNYFQRCSRFSHSSFPNHVDAYGKEPANQERQAAVSRKKERQ
jgi:hypothetical protein